MEAKNKLPEDFKAKWIAALRSGEYKQGKNVLYDRHRDSFCCLGVAGYLMGIPKDAMRSSGYLGFNLDEDYCPMPDNGPKLLVKEYRAFNDIPSQLAKMNDDGYSFDVIADYIEKNL
jgi:hypothetical protein